MYEKYVNIVEALNEAVEVGALTVEDANTLNDLAYENYLTEGSNSDARDVLNQLTPKYKRKIKDAKRAIKAGDKIKAKAILLSLDTEVKMAEKELEKIAKRGSDGDQLVSAIIGAFFTWLKSLGESICLIIAAKSVGYAVSGGEEEVGDAFAGLVVVINKIRRAINLWRNPVSKLASGDSLSVSDFNFYMNDIRSKFKFMHTAIKKLADSI